MTYARPQVTSSHRHRKADRTIDRRPDIRLRTRVLLQGGGRLAALAALLVAALLLGSTLPGSGTAEAQTTVTLVSNTGQTAGTSNRLIGINAGSLWDRASFFTTGANATGYTLSEVDVFMGSTHSTGVKVSIWSATTTGSPESELHVLTNPASFTANAVNTFTAPANTTLAASTTFAVVFQHTAASGSWSAGVTTSHAEDSGAASGWNIGDNRFIRHTTGGVIGSWSRRTGAVFRIAIKGSANAAAAVKLVGNTGKANAGTASFDGAHVAFTTGSNTGGYVLTRVDIRVRASTAGPGRTVTINENSSGSPGTSLGTLTNPSPFPSAWTTAQFAAPSGGIALAASTTYFVKFTGQAAQMRHTSSDDEDAGGLSGWSIANGSTFSGNAQTQTLKFDLYGRAKAAPTVANAIPDQTTGWGTAFSYAFPEDTFNDADGDTLTYTATKSDDTALPGWLTFTPLTRTFSGTSGAGDVGTVSVKVTASDGTASVSDTFDIVVTNNAPTVANPIPDQRAAAGVAFAYSVPANTFNDADGNTLTYTVTKSDGTALPSWLGFSATNRLLSGTPAAGNVGTLSVKVTASDGAASVSDTFDIVVVASNSAPTLANPIPDQRAAAGTAFSYTFPANTFNDGDNDTLSYAALMSSPTIGALPSWLTFTSSTRTFSGTPAAGNVGTISVRVVASDGISAVRDTFDIVVVAANNAPTVANAIPDQTAKPGTAFSYAFPANTFNDPDTGDTLTYTATKSDGTALPSWLTFTAGTRTFSGTPTASGTVSIKVTASDGIASVSDTFDLVVRANSAPTVANPIPDQAAVAGTAFSYTFPANTFNDADGDALLYAATKGDGTALPSWLTFTGSTRTFSGTPGTGNIGTVSVRVIATDGSASVNDTFNIVVKTSNAAPTVANPIPDQLGVKVGTAFSYAFPANTFNDADGDTLTYTATTAAGGALPSWLTFTGSTRTFAGTPGTGNTGSVSIKVTASDGTASVSDTFNIVVEAGPTVSAVAVSSTPSIDADNNGTAETYGLNEIIRVKLTFSEAVTVTGTPRLKIKMDPNFGEFWANYETGSGSTELFFAYTVVSPNVSTQGIAVLENTLALNGGTIRAGTTNASLTHAGLAHDAGHKVDSTRTGTPEPTPDPPDPPDPPQPPTSNPGAQPVTRPDPPNLARNPVQWSSEGGMQALPTAMSQISSNKPSGATGSLNLSAIAASVREELRDRSRGFYVTTMVESASESRQVLRGLEHELARGSPLLKVSIWHVYQRPSTGINTIELLGEVFYPRKVSLLAEPVEICLPAPSADAERARIAVRGRTDSEWTILETALEDGMLCAETVRVSWFVIVLEPEPEDA